MQALTPEQLAGVAGSSSVDDDADGLTNTQEAWWCTDPLNPDTDADGRTDGAEIQALKDWMANKRAGPPGETPWPSWPFNSTTCPDKDHDSIPNLAERWELGLNMDLESSDRDKFDDGQELFGVTYCPGGDLSCGYGDLPRSSDSGYVGAAMPSWVKPPGNHPLVAAFPVPEVDVVESSLHVQTVTQVTDRPNNRLQELRSRTARQRQRGLRVVSPILRLGMIGRKRLQLNLFRLCPCQILCLGCVDSRPRGVEKYTTTATKSVVSKLAGDATSGLLSGILAPYISGTNPFTTFVRRYQKDYSTYLSDLQNPYLDPVTKAAEYAFCGPINPASPITCRWFINEAHPSDRPTSSAPLRVSRIEAQPSKAQRSVSIRPARPRLSRSSTMSRTAIHSPFL